MNSFWVPARFHILYSTQTAGRFRALGVNNKSMENASSEQNCGDSQMLRRGFFCKFAGLLVMFGGRIDCNIAKPMLPDERFERIEREVEFLVHEGARIDQRIAAHHSQIADLDAFLLRLDRSLETLARNTAEGFRETRMKFRATEEQFHFTDERFLATAETLGATDQRLSATDERLKRLIGIVERKLSRS